MWQEKRDVVVIVFSLLLLTCVSSSLLPILPRDETRYLSVAWEMYIHKSLLIPLINGKFYTHKPPLLFWLIILLWKVVGICGGCVRIIPLLFSLASLFLIKKMASLLWGGEREGVVAMYLASGTILWMLWSFLIMFDMLLTFWVLLAIYGGLVWRLRHKKEALVLVMVGTWGGILTKGPVTLLHIISASIALEFSFPPGPLSRKKWWTLMLSSLLLGILLCGSWLIPACIKGGEGYCHNILWTQTLERIHHSFAHKRPLWWYIPLLPVLFFPWSLYLGIWKHAFSLRREPGVKWCLLWFSLTFGLFSIISCKQIHYLLPLIPCISLIGAKAIVSYKENRGPSLPPAVFATMGMGVILLPLLKKIFPHLSLIPTSMCLPLGLILVCGGITLFILRRKEQSFLIRAQTLFIFFIALSNIFLFSHSSLYRRFDLTPMAKAVHDLQKKGKEVTFVGDYEDELGFLGRLTGKIKEISFSKLPHFIRTHPHSFLIIKTSPSTTLPPQLTNRVVMRQPYDRKILLLIRE